ncbi:MAG: ATP-binding cassette domain-containing protein, partial [Anaerolineae bacterium]
MDVRVRDLGYVYPTGVEALRGVMLDIASSEAVAIVGQNGAGKTTLVKHFIGLLRPTRGDVRIGDWDTRAKSVA